MSTSNRRSRRRARARAHAAAKRTVARDTGIRHERAPIKRDTAGALFRTMMPRPARKISMSTPQAERSYTVLQTLTARGTGEHTKGKRTVRYTSVSPWRGVRVGHSDERNTGVRVLKPKRRKGQ
jgi:hypothetical protein